MKYLFVFAFALTAIILAACSGNNSKGYDDSLSPATSTKPVTPLTIADTLLSDTATNRATVTNISSPATTLPVTTTTISGNSATTKAGLNPAHGQPGHRCDIAVGASLSTPVASTPQAKPVVTNPTAAPVSSSPAVNSSFTGKINPPHGQPGHDCSVEVGKPLKN